MSAPSRKHMHHPLETLVVSTSVKGNHRLPQAAAMHDLVRRDNGRQTNSSAIWKSRQLCQFQLSLELTGDPFEFHSSERLSARCAAGLVAFSVCMPFDPEYTK